MIEPRLLLLPLGDGGDEEDRISGALDVALALGAHLRVMHSVLQPHALLPSDIAVPDSALADLEDAMARHATRDIERLQALFARICAARGVEPLEAARAGDAKTASWFEARGVRSALVARHGKLADWLLVSQPPDGQPSASLEAAVTETGRPVLMLPRRLSGFGLDTVMVAWNASPQAARSLASAMALLRRADRVMVISTPDVDMRGPSVEEVADHLTLHGIAVEAQVLDASHAQAGPALLDKAAQEQANALVMGAYSTHKVRDLVFGSVTAHVVAHAGIPAFMAS